MLVKGIEIAIERKAIKNTHLAVYPPDARVHVSAPQHLSDDDIRSFVISKWDWLEKSRHDILGQARQEERKFISGESHYLFGTRYTLQVEETSSGTPGVIIAGRRMKLVVRTETTQKRRGEILLEHYRRELADWIAPEIDKLCKKFGEATVDWQVKRMHSRWGSTSRQKRSIIFNSELARVPFDCIEYIIVHELTHLKVDNHGRLFEKFMDVRLPHWRMLRKKLNDFIAMPE